jgi:hypothetical protein
MQYGSGDGPRGGKTLFDDPAALEGVKNEY